MPEGSRDQLPRPELPPDSVVLEVALVKLPNEVATSQELWSQIDEQHFAPEVRRRLAENGLRVGVLSTQVPDVLRQCLDASPGVAQVIAEGMAPEDDAFLTRTQRLHLRTGKKRRLPVSSVDQGDVVFLICEDGQLRAQRFSKPRCILTLCPTALGNGRVRLDVSPEVEHGEIRQRILGAPGSFLVDVDRQRFVLECLEAIAELSPGQSLVVTCASEARGIGAQFFAATPHGQQARTALLVRLAQTQADDLFTPKPSLTPLTPPAD